MTVILLALDTSTRTSSAALWRDGETLAAADAAVTTHSEALLPLIDGLLRAAGVTPRDLDGVACGAGPGSFTGLRIGLSTAKGVAYALSRPLVLVSSLAALAAEVDVAGALAPLRVLALLDARKKEVYAGLYEVDGGVRAVGPEIVLPPDQLAGRFAGAQVDVVVGDGALAYPEDVRALAGARVHEGRHTPRAAVIARLAAPRFQAGDADVLLAATPAYVRVSDAEIATPPAGLVVPGRDPTSC